MPPSLEALRDQAQQAEYWFQRWTPEHTAWLVMLMMLGGVAWLAWGRGR